MGEPQRHAGHFTGADKDIVLPVRNHSGTLGADDVQPLANVDVEMSASIGTQRMRRLAVCRLPKDLAKRHRSALAAEHNSIQDPFYGLGACQSCSATESKSQR